MDLARLGASWGTLGLVLLSTVVVYSSGVVYTKVAGLRSLATMSTFDFAASVAIGSTVASAANLSMSMATGLFTLALLYVLQALAGLGRRHGVARFMDNRPLMLVADGQVLQGTCERCA